MSLFIYIHIFIKIEKLSKYKMLKFGSLGGEYIGILLEFANRVKVWNYFGIKTFLIYMSQKNMAFCY